MESLPNELWSGILENVQTLMQISLVSNFFLRVVRTGSWSLIKVRVKNQIILEHILSTYKFKNLDLSNTKITDESVSKLIKCHTLNLGGTKITPLRGPYG